MEKNVTDHRRPDIPSHKGQSSRRESIAIAATASLVTAATVGGLTAIYSNRTGESSGTSSTEAQLAGASTRDESSSPSPSSPAVPESPSPSTSSESVKPEPNGLSLRLARDTTIFKRDGETEVAEVKKGDVVDAVCFAANPEQPDKPGQAKVKVEAGGLAGFVAVVSEVEPGRYVYTFDRDPTRIVSPDSAGPIAGPIPEC
jgi:hypothetical protein